MSAEDHFRERVERIRAKAGRGGGARPVGRGARRLGAGGFDPARVALGLRVGAVAGVLLVILMLLPWLGGANAWQLRLVDIALLLVALVAIAAAVSVATGREPFSPRAVALALTAAGGVAVGIMLTLVLESTGGTVPLVLALFAAVGILGGSLSALGQA